MVLSDGTSFELDTGESRVLSLVSQQDNKKLTVGTKFDTDDRDEDVSLEEQVFRSVVTLSIDGIVTLSQTTQDHRVTYLLLGKSY